MSGDNGDIIKEPDREMVAIDDLIIAVKRGKDGAFETLINPKSRTELEIALMRLTHMAYGIFNAMSNEAQKKAIIKPKGSMLNFARGLKR